MSSAPTSRVRLVGLIKRKEGVTREFFSQHWREVHGPIWLSCAIVQKNLLRYEQIHPHQPTGDAFTGVGLTLADVDGIVILEAESYEKVMEVFADPEWQSKVAPDEQTFVETSLVRLFASHTDSTAVLIGR